ncbi:MAG: hypothetical protein JKY37_30160 [Nannocystaceae bacterium]|nr:hypothetical protein [Nannocystaceae bacterium]
MTFLLLTGVPQGFALGDALSIEDATDPETATEFGVAPSCQIDGEPLMPPLRLVAFAEAAAESHADLRAPIASACADDYAPVLAQLAEAITEQVRPICMPACVRDSDDEAEGLQVDCSVEAYVPRLDGTIEAHDLPPCEMADGGAVAVPSSGGCWQARTGEALHPTCADIGFNLEIRLHWQGPVPDALTLRPSCLLSQDKRDDCPELP